MYLLLAWLSANIAIHVRVYLKYKRMTDSFYLSIKAENQEKINKQIHT